MRFQDCANYHLGWAQQLYLPCHDRPHEHCVACCNDLVLSKWTSLDGPVSCKLHWHLPPSLVCCASYEKKQTSKQTNKQTNNKKTTQFYLEAKQTMHATRRYYQTMLRFFLSHSCLEIVQLIICFVSVYKSIMDSNLHSYTLYHKLAEGTCMAVQIW